MELLLSNLTLEERQSRLNPVLYLPVVMGPTHVTKSPVDHQYISVAFRGAPANAASQKIEIFFDESQNQHSIAQFGLQLSKQTLGLRDLRRAQGLLELVPG